jgi:pimeloyl-ACP methyl ester carboxylesterase
MPPRAPSSKRLEPLRHVDAGVLDIAYYEAGPSDGPVAVLLHGFPYDIHSYIDVAPILAGQGCRVIVPYLRGYGPTRFLDPATMRSGEQASIGADLIDLMDALSIPRAVFAGYDWGGRAACIGAALWPERCTGLVSVNSYLIQDIAHALKPAEVEREVALWYQWYFQTERGRAGLAADRRGITRTLWRQWSPNWRFDEACLERTSVAHDNPDYVDIVIHSYRHRYGLAEGDPRYADIRAGSPRCRRSPCPRSRSMVRATASCAPPTGRQAPRNSPGAASIAESRARDIISRRKSRRFSPRP